MKLPVFLCTLTLAALWGPVFAPKQPRTEVMICFNILGFTRCYDVAPEPPPKKIEPIPCHEPTAEGKRWLRTVTL